jgi:hypothetical protein
MSFEIDAMPDRYVAEFLDLAKSANIVFEVRHGHLTMKAINPNWAIWRPCRHLLDEIGQERIRAYLLKSSGSETKVSSVGFANR